MRSYSNIAKVYLVLVFLIIGVGSEIKLWDPSSSKCLATLKDRFMEITALAYLDDMIISGSKEGNIRYWRHNKVEHKIHAHLEPITAVAVLPDKTLASASRDHTVKIWDPNDYGCKYTLKGHTGTVTALASYKNLLISGSSDHTIRLWNPTTGESCKVFSDIGSVSALACYDQFLVVGSSDNTLSLWDIESGKCLSTQITESCTALQSLTNGTICSGTVNGNIEFWNIKI